MKKIITLVAVAMMLCVSASARISPAMDIIAKRLEMRKCTSYSNVVSFSTEDFDGLFGREVQQVTIVATPDSRAGMLTLSGMMVGAGQTIDRSEANELCFSSSDGFTGLADVVFESGDMTGVCSINVLDKANFSPQTGSQTVDTQRNVAVYKTFAAADPDGDRMTYEFINYPDHGSVSVGSGGEVFVYRPADGFVGDDSFSYVALDEYGNKSREQVVEIRVSRPASNVYFDDMKEHWAHNSAIRMAGTGLMTGNVDESGKMCFNPEGDMTRGDFLALSLIMAGHEKNVPFVSRTMFEDDSLIPANIRSYAQYAYDKGIISGYDNGDGTVNFEASASISKAEAAVIVDRILELPENENDMPAYKDAAAIPVWADSAISSLSACGIINGVPGGEISAEKTLTRAEGAEMICNVARYVEDKEKEEKPKKNLFNLFGLLER